MGFAARTHFEVVSTDEIHGYASWSTASDAPGRATYRLDPGSEAYEVWGTGLAHLRFVTLTRTDASSPFTFDLYLHGDPSASDGAGFRIPNLDIRKFLHQSSAALSMDSSLARWNAYFAEFSRKTKVLYRARGGEVAARSSAYERSVLEATRSELQAISRLAREGSGAASKAMRRATTALGDLEAVDLGVLETNLRAAAPRLRDSAADIDLAAIGAGKAAAERLEELISRVVAISTLRKISKLQLINNCREPGNYEISLNDWVGRPLLQASFSFPPDPYNEILLSYDGFSIQSLGTGLRVSEEVRRNDPRYWRSLLPWNWIKHPPTGNIAALTPVGPHSSGPSVALRGTIKVSRGRIPFEKYEAEIRRKSGFRSRAEPLSYVRVDPAKPMPRGFESPDGTSAHAYWLESTNAGKAVPHRYAYFEDLQEFDVLLSGFETNGVYVGQSDLKDFDKEREDGRWRFDYRYLKGLQRFEIREFTESRVEIRLLNGVDAVHFILGNFALPVGGSVEYLLGIAAQPLVSDYNDNVVQEAPLYGLAFASDGSILDHHDTSIGVERVYVERLGRTSYRVRLVAHERILPVWEGVL